MGEQRTPRPERWCAAITPMAFVDDPWLSSALAAAVLAAFLLWGGARWRRSRPGKATLHPAPERTSPRFTATGQDELNAALYAAARSGESTHALELLNAGADPHAPPPADGADQRSLIALAAVLPDLALLRALIARGLDPNHVHAGMSALIAATRDSWHGRPDAVTILLTNGADPHQTDADGNTPLHHAARSSDPGVAALLCDAGAGIEARNHDGVTPLGMACVSGNWRLTKFLIEHGAHTDTGEASPALLSAAATDADDPAGVELLLKHKARVNSRDTCGRSALNEAARHGNAGIIQALLAAGADLDIPDADGRTPLLDAVHGGHLDALDTLISAGADLHTTDACGRNALILACLADNPSLALVQRLLEAGIAADAADHTGRTAIDHAVASGRWALVKCLDPSRPLPASVIDSDSGDGQRPPLDLLRALLRSKQDNPDERAALASLLDADQLSQLLLEHDIASRPEHLRWLLAQGGNPDIRDNDGRTALERLLGRLPDTLPAVNILLQHASTPVHKDALVQILHLCLLGQHTRPELEQCALDLLARSAELTATPPDQPPPLTLAVRLHWDRLVEHLARNGADLNNRDSQGLAALHLAAALGRESTLRLLLRHGAAIDARTQDGQTALGIALAAGHRHLAEWLDWRDWPLPGRALCPHDLPAAAKAGDTRAVLRLIELGLALDASDEQGCTALLRAAGGGHLQLVSHLIEHGADLNQAAHSGATPLSAAVSMGHSPIISRLLQAGADLEHRLPGGLTVLMLAAARGLPDVCHQLLAAGADLHASSDQGLTALHCAAQYGFTAQNPAHLQPLLRTLISAGADSNTASTDGLTPLLMLLGTRAEPGSAGDETVLDQALAQLLDAGAQLSVQEHQRGFGPLHLSALHGLPRITRRLLRAGADPEQRDAHNRPPRAIAIACGFIDIATELTPSTGGSGVSIARFLN